MQTKYTLLLKFLNVLIVFVLNWAQGVVMCDPMESCP